jgi:putative ATP-binding cassette transporter
VVIVPALVVAPRYFAGELDFGGISQASFAFTQVLGALSIIVDQFESLSAFAAGVDRLDSFRTVMLHPEADGSGAVLAPQVERSLGNDIAFQNLTLVIPGTDKALIRELSAQVAQGQGLLIDGPQRLWQEFSAAGDRRSLERGAKASITAPPTNQMMFLPQRPYMPLGSLRHQLLYPYRCGRLADESVANGSGTGQPG